MNPKIAHIITGVGLIAGSILATADRITPLTAISPTLAHAWPFVMAASLLVVNINKQFLPTSGDQKKP